MAAFADPSIRAVLATIGGDDEITLLPHLDPGVVVACPKPFAGYSDNTNLLNWLWNLGVPSYHGGSTMVHLGRGGRLHPRLVRVAARGSHRRRGPGPAPGRGLQRRRAGLGRPEALGQEPSTQPAGERWCGVTALRQQVRLIKVPVTLFSWIRIFAGAAEHLEQRDGLRSIAVGTPARARPIKLPAGRRTGHP